MLINCSNPKNLFVIIQHTSFPTDGHGAEVYCVSVCWLGNIPKKQVKQGQLSLSKLSLMSVDFQEL